MDLAIYNFNVPKDGERCLSGIICINAILHQITEWVFITFPPPILLQMPILFAKAVTIVSKPLTP